MGGVDMGVWVYHDYGFGSSVIVAALVWGFVYIVARFLEGADTPDGDGPELWLSWQQYRDSYRGVNQRDASASR